MFGDDPDTTVTIVRFGFGEVSDTGEGSIHCAKRLRFRQEGKRRTRLVSERSTKARGDAATTRGCKFENNDGNGVPMQCR